jgi:hypothetical protein
MKSFKHASMVVAVMAFGAVAAQGALASCKAPEAPAAIPDGKTAQAEEMLAAKHDVEAYVKAVASYMKCEGDALKLQEVKARQTEMLNWFNAEVRAFNAASSPVKKASYR